MRLNHPKTIPKLALQSVHGKIVSHELVPGAKNVGDHCSVVSSASILAHKAKTFTL